MSAPEHDYFFAWPFAIIDAEDAKFAKDSKKIKGSERAKDRKYSDCIGRIEQLLRDERVPITMLDRHMLADLLNTLLKPQKKGRRNEGIRDYGMFMEVEFWKQTHNSETIPETVMEEIGKKHGLLSLDTCRSAYKRGRRFAQEAWSADKD